VDIEVESEKARLTRAELLIEKFEKQVAEQEKQIAEQRANGHQVGVSEQFVQNFVEILSAWRHYRTQVLTRLELLSHPAA
jgi:pimeloyl-CoA synthetase